jgi:hypothetical protein
VVDRVYHANKTKKSYESKGHGDQINTSKSITNRLIFVLFLFCFSFFAAFSVFVPFFFFFSHPIVLPVICQCLSLFYRFAQHVAGGEWTVATIPAHIILSLYQTFPILSIISMSFLFFFVRLLILSMTYQC